MTGTEIDLHDLNLGLLIDQTGFDVIYENEIFDQIMNIQQCENPYFAQLTPQLGIPVNDPTLSHSSQFAPAMNQERNETTNYSQTPANMDLTPPNPAGNLNEENIMNSMEANRARIEFNANERHQIGSEAAEINEYNHHVQPVDILEIINEEPQVEYTICCNQKFILDNYKNSILNSCPFNLMYTFQSKYKLIIFCYIDGNILYPKCPICQKLLYPQMLRCLFERAKINELESKYRESDQKIDNICAECKLIIAKGEIDKDYYILSDCNHNFHADCIIGLYTLAPSIKCPAANCEHTLTREEIMKIRKRVEMKKKERTKESTKSYKISPIEQINLNKVNIRARNSKEIGEPLIAPHHFPIDNEEIFKEPLGNRLTGNRDMEGRANQTDLSYATVERAATAYNKERRNQSIICRINTPRFRGENPNHSQIITTCCDTKFMMIPYWNQILKQCPLDTMYQLSEGTQSIYINRGKYYLPHVSQVS